MWEAAAIIVAALITVYGTHRIRHSTAFSDSSASIQDVSFAMDEIQDDRLGMTIFVNASICNLAGIDCRLAVYFYTAAGEPVCDYNGEYTTSDGHVSTSIPLLPARREDGFLDAELFIPYDELHLTRGTHDLSLFVCILRESNNQTLASTGYYPWRFTYANTPKPHKAPNRRSKRRKAS